MSIVTGSVAQSQAYANRQLIQLGGSTVQLPNGTIQLDTGLAPTNSQIIKGPATLVNQYDVNGRSLGSFGEGLGYFDSLTTSPNSHVAVLTDPTTASHYVPGNPVYLYKVDGFQIGTGQLRSLVGVRSVSGANVTFDGPVLDTRQNAANYFVDGGIAVQDVKQGDVAVVAINRTYTNPPSKFVTSANTVKPGDFVLLTEGPSVANEGRDEWRRVVQVVGSTIYLDLPASRNYTLAILAKARPTLHVKLDSVTMNAPALGVLESFAVKYGLGWQVYNCTLNGNSGMAGCSSWTVKGCTINAMQINSCENMSYINSTFGSAGMEECCTTNRFMGCTFGPSAVPLSCNTLVERAEIRGCTITGATSQPIGLTCNDLIVDGLDVVSTGGGASGCFFIGDRMTLMNIRADCDIFIQQGEGIYCRNIYTTGRIFLGDSRIPGRTSGTALNCVASGGVSVGSGSWVVL